MSSDPTKRTKQAISLRRLEPSDSDFLKEMVYIALWDAPDEPRRPRKALEHPMVKAYYEDWGKKEGDLGLVAEVDGKPVGMVTLRVKECITKLHTDLPELGIAIEDEYQGMGIGSQLFEAIIEQAKERFAGIRLGVNPKNVRAMGLYEKYGFKHYETPEGQYPQMVLLFDNN